MFSNLRRRSLLIGCKAFNEASTYVLDLHVMMMDALLMVVVLLGLGLWAI
jgi:hypothetical protein